MPCEDVYLAQNLRHCVLAALLLGSPLAAQEPGEPVVELEPLAVVASRQFGDRSTGTPLWQRWDGTDLDQAIPLTLDAVLAEDLAFSLFRRQGATYAHPTTQGASLRSLGPTAAARSLVVRDGVPQNDPFGGWLPWARFAPGTVASLEVLPSAQASAWGNQSAGGVIQLETLDPFTAQNRARVLGGSFATRAGEVIVGGRAGAFAGWVSGRSFVSDGDFLVHPDSRGPIDERADLTFRAVDAKGAWRIGRDSRLEPSFSYYEEKRGNGTPLARNQTRALDLSLRARGRGDTIDWEAVSYFQRRDFENQFTAVDDAHTAENPVLNQFDIPGEAVGGSLTGTWRTGPTTWMLGADGRVLWGETNEDFSFGLDDRRRAGGRQSLGGVFGRVVHPLALVQALELNARFDRWALVDGFREERTLPDEEILVDERYDDQTGLEPSLSLAWVARPDPAWSLFVGAGQAFRLPTINELYRPFRVGADVTGANSGLQPERFRHLEGTVRWAPTAAWELRGGVFHYWIEDAIANVFVFSRPGPSPGGFVPAGGTYSERQNVDHSTVFGSHHRLCWTPSERWSWQLEYLWTEAAFRTNAAQPLLESRTFPQVPRHRWRSRLVWSPSPRWQVSGEWEYGAAQFEDPFNKRSLPGWHRLGVGLRARLAEGWNLRLRLDNLADATVITGEDGAGEREVAPGRALRVALEWLP